MNWAIPVPAQAQEAAARNPDFLVTGTGGSQPLESFLKRRVQDNPKLYVGRSLNFPVTLQNTSGEVLIIRGAEGGVSGPFRWRGGQFPGDGGDLNKGTVAPNDSFRMRFELALIPKEGRATADGKVLLNDPIVVLYAKQSDPDTVLRLELKNELLMDQEHVLRVGIRSPVRYGVGDEFGTSSIPENVFGYLTDTDTPFFPEKKVIPLGRAPVGALRRVGLRVAVDGPRPTQQVLAKVSVAGSGFRLLGSGEVQLGGVSGSEGLVFIEWSTLESSTLTGELTLTYTVGSQQIESGYYLEAESYKPTFANNALLLVNSNSRFSQQVLEHYRATRPGASSAPVLSVALDPGDLDETLTHRSTTMPQRQRGVSLSAAGAHKVVQAVTKWYSDHARGEEYYLVVFPDIPTNIRVSTSARQEFGMFQDVNRRSPCDTELQRGVRFEQYAANVRWCRPSLHSVLYWELRDKGFLLEDPYGLRMSVMEVGTEEETRAYIDKLARKHGQTGRPLSAFSNSDIIPALSESQSAEGRYYFVGNDKQCRVQTDERGERIVGGRLENCPNLRMQNSHFTAFHLLKAVNPTRPVRLVLGAPNRPHVMAEPLKGLGTDGRYATGHSEHYATDGTYRLVEGRGALNDGYILRTTESHNGNAGRGAAFGSWHGHVGRWFRADAFGGANYNATPIAAYVHGEEPGFDGIHSSLLYAFWEAGELAADIHLYSIAHSNAYHVGDPFVVHSDRARP